MHAQFIAHRVKAVAATAVNDPGGRFLTIFASDQNSGRATITLHFEHEDGLAQLSKEISEAINNASEAKDTP